MVNEDFSQPFFVGRNNPRFRHQSADGYMAALEPEIEASEPPPEQIIVHRHSDLSAQEADMLQQAVLGIADLRKKSKRLFELLEREKNKPGKEQGYY